MGELEIINEEIEKLEKDKVNKDNMIKALKLIKSKLEKEIK